MRQWIKILCIGVFMLLLEIFVFRVHLSPILWGKLKVSGLACTCPDESVDKGRLYLRYITPDSLKKYSLNYSEIYVSEPINDPKDPMGAGQYLITCRVIGKDRVDAYAPWNPKVKIEKWQPIPLIPDLIIKVLFVSQLLILGWIVLRKRNNNGVHQSSKLQ